MTLALGMECQVWEEPNGISSQRLSQQSFLTPPGLWGKVLPGTAEPVRGPCWEQRLPPSHAVLEREADLDHLPTPDSCTCRPRTFSGLGTGDWFTCDSDLALNVSGPVSSPGRVNTIASQRHSGDCIIASILELRR